MFKWNRVLVALIGVPLLAFIYTNMTFKGIPLLIFSLFVVGVGLSEFYDMISASGREVYKKFGIFIGILIVFLTYLRGINLYFVESEGVFNKIIFWINYYLDIFNLSIMNIFILFPIILLIYRILKNQIKGTLDSVAFTLLGIVYVAVFFSQILNLYFIDYRGYATAEETSKLTLIMVLQILVWVSDTSAGIVGVAIGRKFFRNGFTEISPKKSVEGSISSLIFTGLAAVMIFSVISDFNMDLKFNLVSFGIGAITGLIAQVGDLIESLFKRECGVKDSGAILMGHGGVLDRFDSMLLVLPVVAYFIGVF